MDRPGRRDRGSGRCRWGVMDTRPSRTCDACIVVPATAPGGVHVSDLVPATPPSTAAPVEPPAVTTPAQDATLLERALFEVKRVIVGQDRMVERMLVALLARGHCLLEGRARAWPRRWPWRPWPRSSAAASPGSSSPPTWCRPTSSVPASTGRSSEKFDVELGPVFVNFLLADEINRAPAKVQSALLEVMAEQQVSIGGQHPRGAPAVPGDGDPEPDRAGGRLPAARGAARPVPDEDPWSATRPTPRSARSSTGWASSAPEPRPGARPRRADPRCRSRADAVFVHNALVDYVVRLVLATRDAGPATACPTWPS